MSKCCKKYGPTSDNGMSTLLLNNIATRTRPSVENCCTGKYVYSNCKCSGNAGSLANNNIYRDHEILQTLKSTCCGNKNTNIISAQPTIRRSNQAQPRPALPVIEPDLGPGGEGPRRTFPIAPVINEVINDIFRLFNIVQ